MATYPLLLTKPICLFPPFLPLAQPCTLRITKAIPFFSPSTFSIAQIPPGDCTGSIPLLQVKDKIQSLHAIKEVWDTRKDGTGRLVCEISREVGIGRRSWVISGYEGKEVLRVREGGRFDSSTVSATVSLPDGTQREILLQTNFFDTNAEIIDPVNNLVLARIDRKFLSGRVIYSSLKYTAHVAAGLDFVLVVVLCVCWEEVSNGKKK